MIKKHYLGNISIEIVHVFSKMAAELSKDTSLDIVVLQVNFRLDSSVVNYDRSEGFLRIRSIECHSRLPVDN